jgi:hypothetical protein
MVKFIVALVVTAILAFTLSINFSWYMIAVAAFLIAVIIPQKESKSFLAGFLAIFFLWGGLAAYMHFTGSSALGITIAKLLPLGGNPLLLILVTAFVGAIVGGFSAWSGSTFRKLIKQKKLASA